LVEPAKRLYFFDKKTTRSINNLRILQYLHRSIEGISGAEKGWSPEKGGRTGAGNISIFPVLRVGRKSASLNHSARYHAPQSAQNPPESNYGSGWRAHFELDVNDLGSKNEKDELPEDL
jgi:hypothetical protein